MSLRWLPWALLAIGCLRIASTWQVLTQTFDESFHIVCGMEWWDQGRYTRERQHPPLARIAIGALPYWTGSRSHNLAETHKEGNAILGTGEAYWRTLALARAGTLPFFVLFCCSVWRWAVRLWGPAAGSGTVFVATQLPAVLGNGGLATTDMAVLGTLAFTGWRFWEWLEAPCWWRAALAGLGIGLAVSSKMSNLLFVGVMIVVLCAPRWRLTLRLVSQAPLLLLPALFVVAAVYRFAPEGPPYGHSVVQRVLGLSAFFYNYGNGLLEVLKHNNLGHHSFLLGRGIQFGDWRFFPVAVGVKTPLPVLILFVVAWRWRQARWACVLALLLLAVLLPARINLGLRHALPVYVGLSMAAGFALAQLWDSRRWAAVLLGGWLMCNTALAGPDYFPWFNELAFGRPERILAESDLDWGQDLHRIVAAMDRRGLKSCGLAYFGTADWAALAPGRFEEFPWDTPRTGCFAVSIRWQSLMAAFARQSGDAEPFPWLTGREPVERVGRSMLLYVVPDSR